MGRRAYLISLLVSMTCLIGAGVGGYFLYSDLNLSGMGGTGKSVGKVEKKESTVRRKSASSYVWTNVQSNEELYRKDSVQTGEGSAATVRLEDGTLLDISENSLVVMDQSTHLSVQFLRGSAVIHGATGDKKVSVGKDGKAKIEELSARLIKPESLARFFVIGNDQKDITFSWELKGRVTTESNLLQVSTDKRFSPSVTQNLVLTDLKSDIKVKALSAKLGPGSYYWRISGKKGPLSGTRQFKVASALPLQPIYPENLANLSSADPEALVQFRWLYSRIPGKEDSDFSQGQHHLEVARDSQFRFISQKGMINPSAGQMSLKSIQNGMNYWRIRSQYGDVQTLSLVRSFQFTKLKPSPNTSPSSLPTPSPTPTLSAPISAKPENGKVFHLLDKKNPIEVTWSEVPDVQLYEVTIYSDSKQNHTKKLVLRQETQKNRMDLRQLGPGDYLWTVRSIGKEKNLASLPIPWKRFTLDYGEVLRPPKILSPEVQ